MDTARVSKVRYRWKETFAIGKSQVAIVCESGHLLFIDFTEENMSF
jgi:hypothetical protein